MKKILMLEDDKFLIKIYGLKLREKGMEVIMMENGLGVLETVKREKPNLILLDLIMPKIDGFEVLKQLKKDNETKNVPVIVLTNLKYDSMVFDGIGVKPEKYIEKAEATFASVIVEIEKYLNK